MQNSQEHNNHIPEGFRDETDLIMFMYRDLKSVRKELGSISIKQEDMDKVLLDYRLLKAKMGAYFLAANVITGVIGFLMDKVLK